MHIFCRLGFHNERATSICNGVYHWWLFCCKRCGCNRIVAKMKCDRECDRYKETYEKK